MSLQRGRHGRSHGSGRDPWAELPPLAERTRLVDDPLGPLLLQVAGWLATCGGATVGPG